MMLKKIVSGILFIAGFSACVDSFTPRINNDDSKPLLVIEGRVTNETGPFKVRLSQTVPISSPDSVSPVANAKVRISDDHNHSYRLFYNGKGNYQTSENNLSGITGYNYTLSITTGDSIRFLSTAVQMQDVPKIDSLYFEEVQHPRIQEGKTYQDTWMNILVNTHGSGNTGKNWLFDFEETWEVNLLADPVNVHHSVQYPENIDHAFLTSTENNKRCWVTKPSSSILLVSTEKNDINEISRYPLQQIGPGDSRLHIRYSILVKQYALNKDLYSYFKTLQDINENTGGLYEKIPTPIFGNVTSTDGNTKTLGYFMASAVSMKRLFVTRSEHHVETVNANSDCYFFDFAVSNTTQKYLLGYNVLTGGAAWCSTKGCTDCTIYGTNIKPSYW